MKTLTFLSRWLLVFSCLCLPLRASSAAPVFTLSASSSELQFGQPFTVNLIANGLTDLYAYQLDLDFNPAFFQAESVTEGAFLGSAASTFFSGGTIDNTGGLISLVFDTLLGPGPGASGSGILGSISFVDVGAGPATVMFSLSDVLALDSNLNAIPVQTLPLALEVPVPEPSALLLILSAFIGLMLTTACKWRRPIFLRGFGGH